jgi:hypothetical protein
MPNLPDIQMRILSYKNAGQDVIRREYLASLNNYTKRDTIVYAAAYASGKGGVPPYTLSISTEDIQGFMASINGLKSDQLDLILHSPGGSLEAAEQIVNYLRAKYKHIRVIVPQNAMSAATMIACAADVIIMGKQSAIGPIDPQITFPTQHGPFTAPAQALLDDFAQAKVEVISTPNVAPLWVSKMKDYPPGIFHICQTTIDLAKEKVAQWMEQYMFKGDSNANLTANSIAAWLGDAHLHKTHGHPINFDEALAHGLKVERLEADQEFQDKVLTVFHAVSVTFGVTNCVKMVENHNGKGLFVQIEPQTVKNK